jgi:hypothetical protein
MYKLSTKHVIEMGQTRQTTATISVISFILSFLVTQNLLIS